MTDYSRRILLQILGDSTGFSKATTEATTASGKFQNVLAGIGQGIGQGVFGVLQTGISDVTGFLTGSIEAASKDQLSMAQLGATLAANVPAWDGNKAAIEDYITSAENASAFSKDDLRSSLESLVGATHDVTKAEQDQTTATNLAHYKNIDLATATQLVVDAEAGRFKGLVQLGINTKGLTSSTQALADINAVVAGQDTTYLTTAAGQEQVLTNKIDDLQVEIGQKLMPTLERVLAFVNDNFIPAMNALGNIWDQALNLLTAGGSHALALYNSQQDAIKAAQDAANAAREKSNADSWARELRHDEDQGPQIVTAMQQINDDIAAAAAGQTAANDYAKSLIPDAKPVIDGWDSFEAPVTEEMVKVGNKWEAASKKQIADGKAQMHAVAGAWTPSSIDLDPLIIPDSTKLKTLLKQITELKASIAKEMNSGAYTQAEANQTKLDTLVKEYDDIVAADRAATGYGGTGTKRLASGGYVPARAGGTLAILGEGGQGEYVVPENQMGRSGGTTYNIIIPQGAYIDGFGIDRLVDKIALRMRLRGSN